AQERRTGPLVQRARPIGGGRRRGAARPPPRAVLLPADVRPAGGPAGRRPPSAVARPAGPRTVVTTPGSGGLPVAADGVRRGGPARSPRPREGCGRRAVARRQ